MEAADYDKRSHAEDEVARLVEQIAAAELASASIVQDSPDMTPPRDSRPVSRNTPSTSRSKSPLFSTRYKQGVLKEMRKQKAVISNQTGSK